MIVVQNSTRNVIAVGTTVPKALFNAGIPAIKCKYIRKKIASHGMEKEVKWKNYFLSKW